MDKTTDGTSPGPFNPDSQTSRETPRSPSPEEKQETGTVSYIFENLVECIHFVKQF